jgi:hypothetical protein
MDLLHQQCQDNQVIQVPITGKLDQANQVAPTQVHLVNQTHRAQELRVEILVQTVLEVHTQALPSQHLAAPILVHQDNLVLQLHPRAHTLEPQVPVHTQDPPNPMNCHHTRENKHVFLAWVSFCKKY